MPFMAMAGVVVCDVVMAGVVMPVLVVGAHAVRTATPLAGCRLSSIATFELDGRQNRRC